MFRNAIVQLLLPVNNLFFLHKLSECQVSCFIYRWSQGIRKAEPDCLVWFFVHLWSTSKHIDRLCFQLSTPASFQFFFLPLPENYCPTYCCHISKGCLFSTTVLVKCWNPRLRAQVYKQLISFLGRSVFNWNNIW